MIGIAVDGRCIGGFIHKPFSNETIWSWKKSRNSVLNHLHLLDEVELNREYKDDEGPRYCQSALLVASSTNFKVVRNSFTNNFSTAISQAGNAKYLQKLFSVRKISNEFFLICSESNICYFLRLKRLKL